MIIDIEHKRSNKCIIDVFLGKKKKNWRSEKNTQSKIEENNPEMMTLVCRSKKYSIFQEKSIQ